MSSPECKFCNISSEPERVIKTGSLFTSFLSDPRLTTGHALVVPNRHAECITDLSSGEILDMFDEAKRIANLLLGTVGVGVDVLTKARPEMPENGIKMNHLHTHVIPSNPGDELYSTGLVWTDDRFQPMSEAECNDMAELLRERREDLSL